MYSSVNDPRPTEIIFKLKLNCFFFLRRGQGFEFGVLNSFITYSWSVYSFRNLSSIFFVDECCSINTFDIHNSKRLKNRCEWTSSLLAEPCSETQINNTLHDPYSFPYFINDWKLTFYILLRYWKCLLESREEKQYLFLFQHLKLFLAR